MTDPGGPEPTPAVLLAEARRIAKRPAVWGSCWPRATAILARQALEDAIDTIWTGPTATMRSRPWTDKLTCLPWYTDPDTGHRARHTWHALTNACHAHPYELAPTAGELHGWISEVEAVLGGLLPPGCGTPAPGEAATSGAEAERPT